MYSLIVVCVTLACVCCGVPRDCQVPNIRNVLFSNAHPKDYKRHGFTLEVKCADGFTLDDNRAVRCNDGTWSTSPRCRAARDCQVPNIRNVLFSNAHPKDYKRHGFTLEVKCADGFIIDDNRAVKCNDGTWSTFPRCRTARQCQVRKIPDTIITNTHLGDLEDHSFTLELKCADGFILNDNATVTCNDGYWSTVPKCVAARQCQVPNIEYAIFSSGQTGDLKDHNFTLEIKCEVPFNLNDKRKVTCNDGIWSTIPKCVAAHQCEIPYIRHAINSGERMGDLKYHGFILEVKCAHRFILTTNRKVTCNDGIWSIVPECVAARQCQVPRILYAIFSNAREDDFKDHGFTLEIKCEVPYIVSHNQKVTCNNGTWSAVTKCVPARHCEVPKIPNGITSDFTWTFHGFTLDATCARGFVLNDNRVGKCNDGNWTYVPTCVADLETRACKHTRQEGNKLCFKRCQSNRDCAQFNMMCLCDGVCGKSCILTNQCKLPIFSKATITGVREGEYQNSNITVILTCDPGFVLSNARPVTCRMGTWTVIPKCTPKLCKVPFIEYGHVHYFSVGDLTENGTTLIIFCDGGYIPNSYRTMQCHNGEWSIIPKCVPDGDTRRCDYYLERMRIESQYPKKRKCFTQCHSDRDCPGRREKCLCDGMCVRSCIDFSAYCHVPVIKNATVTSDFDKEWHDHNSYIEIKCDPGFVLSGTHKVTCQNGRWSTIPQCVPSPCQVPNITNAEISGRHAGEQVDHGLTIEPECNGGFYITQSGPIRCNMTSWAFIPTCVADGDTQVCYYANRQPPKGMKCSKSCHSDRDCTDTGRKCFCNGKCTRSCIDSTQCRIPIIKNATVTEYIDRDWQDHNSSIEINCIPGLVLNKTDKVTCQNGSWSIIPQCVPGPCQVPDITNAEISGRHPGELVDHGLTIEPECNVGFYITQSGPIRCNMTSWAFIPTCVPDGDTRVCDDDSPDNLNRKCSKSCNSDRDCTDGGGKCLCDGKCGRSCINPTQCRVPAIDNATVTGDSNREWQDHNSSIEIKCNSGLVLSGTHNVTCQNGSWSTIPQCVPGQCKVPDIQNAEISGRHAGDLINHGLTIEPTCNVGFNISQSGPIRCDTGSWTFIPTCVPDQCRVQAIIKGTFTEANEREWINNGVTIKPKCDIGHVVNDPNEVRCVNGTWSIIPSCVPDQCRVPAIIKGTFTEAKKGEWINNGVTIKPKCDIGHVVNDPNEVRCVNGTWSIIPSCVPGAQCQIPAIMNGTFVGGREGDLRDHDFTIEPLCSDGFRLNNPKAVTCDNGDWSIIPQCVPGVLCKEPENPPHGEYYRIIATPTSWIKLFCISGYSVAGQADRKCQANGTWSGQAPTCEAICQFDPPEVNNSRYRCYSKFHGVTVSYLCNPGYKHRNKNAVLTCWKGQWVGEMPICVEVGRCKEPEHPRHGKYNGTNFTETSVIRLECDEGYRIIGQAARTCQDKGSWSGPAATCEVVTCPDPVHPPDGRIEGRNFTFSSMIKLACRSGYDVVGPVHRTCKTDGTWSGHAASCKFSCGLLKQYAHSRPNNNATTEGSSVNFTCENGYGKYNRGHDLICTGGYWVGDFVGCQKYLYCDKLQDPIYGNYKYDYESQRYPYKYVAKLECHPSYTKDGDVERRCLEDRTWSATAPTCEKNCTYQQAPPNISNSERIQTGTKHRDTVTYKCNEGYVLSTNNSVITCWKGEWVGETPVCSKDDGKISCGLPMEDKNAHQYYNCILEGCTANYTCHAGYGRYNQPPDFTCLSGKWVGDFRGCHKYLECDKLQDPIYGIYKYDYESQRYPYKSVAKLECDPSYAKDVDVERRCLENRTWSEPAPTCEKHCHDERNPGHVANSQSFQTGILHKDTVTYKCFDGYTNSTNNSVITCWKGKWVGEKPVCTKVIICEKPRHPPHGTYMGTNFTFNSVITLVCQKGYDVDGPKKRTCMANSAWSDHPAYCQEICGEPKNYSNSLKNYNGVFNGSTVNYTCKRGYGRHLGHPPDFTCLNGKWVGKFDGCKDIHTLSSDIRCKEPPHPEFGEYIGGLVYKLDDVLILDCNKNYSVVGFAVVRCNENGTWSNTPENCPREPPFVENSKHKFSKTFLHGSRVTYRCKDGYTFSSVDTHLTCYKGLWLGKIPNCIKKSAA